MKTVFTKLATRSAVEDPIYISRTQWEDSAYIPDEVLNRIAIVDFKEEDNDNRAEDTESN